MKFICLGYIEENKMESFAPEEAQAMMEECFTYDDVLRDGGHFAGGEALQGPRTAKTLRFENGKTVVTDGPYAETKEQIGGILILEAKDMAEAVALMSKHPGVRLGGPFEIRPAEPMINELIAARDAAKNK
ncbi:MAG: YciI family protein [Planctomycetes bacterium]|nr:YciI family protein [Planctomycetota bacterium]